MKMHICIISTPEEFVIKLIEDDKLEACSNIVAVHPHMQSALNGLERAKSLEKSMRPMWTAAVEHERRLRNTMLEAVWSAAKPIAKPTTSD